MKTKICNIFSVLNLVHNDEHPNRVHDKKWLRQNAERLLMKDSENLLNDFQLLW